MLATSSKPAQKLIPKVYHWLDSLAVDCNLRGFATTGPFLHKFKNRTTLNLVIDVAGPQSPVEVRVTIKDALTNNENCMFLHVCFSDGQPLLNYQPAVSAGLMRDWILITKNVKVSDILLLLLETEAAGKSESNVLETALPCIASS